MDNNELLIQIEKLLDCKLEGRFDSLEGRLDSLEEKFDSLEGRFNSLEGRFNSLEGRFNSLEGRFNSLELKVQSIDDRLIAVEGDLSPIKRTCLRVENEIIPKLDALYEDRIPHAEFSRLSDRVEKNTHMLLVMKDVIINHSGEIQHLKEVK